MSTHKESAELLLASVWDRKTDTREIEATAAVAQVHATLHLAECVQQLATLLAAQPPSTG